MILVTASIRAREDAFDQLLAASRQHVAHSRQEPGCISHDVYLDPEDPLRLVFVERWQSKEALAAHFQVPGARQYVAQLEGKVTEAPSMEIFDTTKIEI